MRAFSSPTKAARAAFLTGFLGLVVAVPVSADAAQASSTISVTITGTASAVSLATGIRFSTIGLPGASALSSGGTPPQGGVPVGTGGVTISGDELAAGGGSMPGAFVVSGDRRQAFSISLPQKVVLDVDGTLLELREFRHSGGSTPSTGPDGTIWIAFTADVNRDQLDIFRNIASLDTGTIYLEIPADAVAAQGIAVAGSDDAPPSEPRWVATRKPVPFGTPDELDKLIFVLISYN